MTKNKINLPKAIQQACNGFKGWWIPLCLISSVIFMSQSWLPKYIFNSVLDHDKFEIIKKIYHKYVFVSSLDPDLLFQRVKAFFIELHTTPELANYINELLFKSITIFTCIFLLICFLYIATVIISKASVNQADRKSSDLKKNLSNSHFLTLSYLLLSFIKSLIFVIPFIVPMLYLCLKLNHYSNLSFLGIPPGLFHLLEFLFILFLTFFLFLFAVYLYIRFYFTSFIITEDSSNPFSAIKKSWIITRENFKDLFILFILTLIIDIISLITVIGFIPGTGFKYTLRASAYMQLTDNQ